MSATDVQWKPGCAQPSRGNDITDSMGLTLQVDHWTHGQEGKARQGQCLFGFFVLFCFVSFVLYFLNLIFISYYSWYNVMLVSGVSQQSDSFIHIHISIIFQIHFPYRLLQSIEYSSPCYAVGPCWLFILYIVVCVCVFIRSSWFIPLPTNIYLFLKLFKVCLQNCKTRTNTTL